MPDPLDAPFPDAEPGVDVPAAERVRGRTLDLVRGSLWTLVAAATGLPIGFAANLVLARVLGADGLGHLATLVALSGLSTTIVNLGVSQATVQWVAELAAPASDPRRRHLVRNCVGYHAFVEAPIVAVVAALLVRHSSPWVWLLAGAALLATQVLGTASVLLTATARNQAAAQIALVVGVASQVLTVAAAVATRSAATTFAVELAATALGPLVAYLTLDGEDRSAFRRPLVARHLPPGFLRFALSWCGSSLVGTLVFGRSEIFVLQAHHLHADAGIFALATGLAGQITVPMDSLMGPLLPTAAGLLAAAPERVTEAAQRTLRVTALLGSLTMAVVVPTVVVAIPLLFGGQFHRARGALVALGLVSCLQSISVPLSTLVLARRRAGAVLAYDVTSLVADAALAIGLVPVIGLWGAVVANGASQLLSLTLLAAAGARRAGIASRAVPSACRPVVVGVAATGLGVALAFAPLPTLLKLVTCPVVGVLGVGLGLRVLPDARMGAADVALIEDGLPAQLRRVFHRTGRALGLIGAPLS